MISPDDNYLFLALSSDGSLAAFRYGSELLIWDVLAGEEKITFHKQREVDSPSPARHAAFSPNSLLLASGDVSGSTRLWDVSTGEELVTIDPDEFYGAVGDLSFDSTGEWLAITYFRLDPPAQAGPIQLFNLTTGTQQLISQGLYPFVFAQNGSLFAYSDLSGAIHIGNLDSGSLLYSFTGNARDTRVRSIVFSPEEGVFAINYFDRVVLMDTETWAVIFTLDKYIYSMALSSKRNLIALVGEENISLFRYE
jgi:WD40 repeat protein